MFESECTVSDVAVCCFFFQAEDGIRDLVRSRGLGDVYKRQVHESAAEVEQVGAAFRDALAGHSSSAALRRTLAALAPQGITEGSLFVPAGFAEIPLII